MYFTILCFFAHSMLMMNIPLKLQEKVKVRASLWMSLSLNKPHSDGTSLLVLDKVFKLLSAYISITCSERNKVFNIYHSEEAKPPYIL